MSLYPLGGADAPFRLEQYLICSQSHKGSKNLLWDNIEVKDCYRGCMTELKLGKSRE